MTNYQWKILETLIVDGALKSIKYWCKATDDKNSVETEGNWKMRAIQLVDEDTTENHVIAWLDVDATQEGKHLIKYRLQEQLDALKLVKTTKLPWVVETFKVTI
jgi:hypothetical protein